MPREHYAKYSQYLDRLLFVVINQKTNMTIF